MAVNLENEDRRILIKIIRLPVATLVLTIFSTSRGWYKKRSSKPKRIISSIFAVSFGGWRLVISRSKLVVMRSNANLERLDF